jgi:uncharacterized protein HemX
MENNNPNQEPISASTPPPAVNSVPPQPAAQFVPPVMQQMPQSTPPIAPTKGSSSFASLIALVVILALLAVGAFYFWNERMEKGAAEGPNNDALQTINSQSASDLEADIEADLNATDIDNVDYDLDPENFNAS